MARLPPSKRITTTSAAAAESEQRLLVFRGGQVDGIQRLDCGEVLGKPVQRLPGGQEVGVGRGNEKEHQTSNTMIDRSLNSSVIAAHSARVPAHDCSPSRVSRW